MIIGIMPIHGREMITKEAVRCLKAQVNKVIVAGDDDGDEHLAKEMGVGFIKCLDVLLSQKFQLLFIEAKKYNPDAVVLDGSDDLLSPNWVETCYKWIKDGFDLVGKSKCWFCKIMPNEKMVLNEVIYGEARANEPFGSGRLFSRRILDKVNWRPYPDNVVSRACDLTSYTYLKNNGLKKVKILNEEDIRLVCVKSDWECLDSFGKVEELAVSRPDIIKFIQQPNPKEWIEKHFPTLEEHLRRVVPNYL